MSTQSESVKHETFDGAQQATESEVKLDVRKRANVLMADLASMDLHFSTEITSALLSRLIKRVKEEGTDSQKSRLWDMLETASDHATAKT